MIDSVLQVFPALVVWQAHIALLFLFFVFVWRKSLFNPGMLIDDVDGIAKYRDRYDEKTDKVITTYKYGDKYEFKHCAFNPLVGFPGCLIRWVRLNIGRKFTVIGKNKKGHDVYGYIQSPHKHHMLSLVSQFINLTLGYFLLSRLFNHDLAFMTMLMFSVFPVSVQAVAWISGIGYLWSLMWVLICLNCVVYLTHVYTVIALTTLFSGLASFTLLAGAHVWGVLAVMGHVPEAIVAFLVAAVVVYRQWSQVVAFRSKAFKDQNMGRSTAFKARKLIVMMKTLWYYLKFLAWPMKLGLFHTWGYHYEDKIEHVDRRFFCGFIALCIMVFMLFTAPPVIKFGIMWFFMFIMTFLNAITAQQFVVDRYLFIPSLGFCLIFSAVLQGAPYLFYLVLGLYAMRCMLHIPTFRSEIDFYLSNSNTSNFMDSEVALGNLGVIYMNAGLPGSAVDCWMRATKINPFYDVPWYNLYSIFKTNNMLDKAKEYLTHCLNAKTVHFNDHWQKEMDQLNIMIASRQGMRPALDKMNLALKEK